MIFPRFVINLSQQTERSGETRQICALKPSLSATTTSSVSLNSDIIKTFEKIKASLSRKPLNMSLLLVVSSQHILSYPTSSKKYIRKYFTQPLTINAPAFQSNKRVQLAEEQSTSSKNIHKIFSVRIQNSRLSNLLRIVLGEPVSPKLFVPGS